MNIKKELRDWSIMILVLGILYFTGYHRDLGSFIQRMVLETRLMQPDTTHKEWEMADYDFSLENEQGEVIPFDTFQGQTVFLNFWATWCSPCIAEMPGIDDLYDRTQSENISFVMISVDDSFDQAKKLKEKKGYSFPIYQLRSKRPHVFTQRSIPVTFVISAQGQIISKKTGMAKYNTERFERFLIDSSKSQVRSEVNETSAGI